MILELSCDAGAATDATLRATVRSRALDDTAVVLGIALANGKVYLPTGFTLRVRRSPGLEEEEFSYAHPQHVRVNGRIDPWVVPLPRGSSYAISIPAGHFRPISGTSFKPLELSKEPFDMRLALDARPIERTSSDMPGLRLMKVWAGTLASNVIRVPNDCSRGMR